jgi:hypothetical protein
MGLLCCCFKCLKRTEQSNMQRSEFSKIPSDRDGGGGRSRTVAAIENDRRPKETKIPVREPVFVPNIEVEATYFEDTWQDAENSSQFWSTKLDSVPESNVVLQLFEKRNIFCLASGTQGDCRKYYFYARESKKGPLHMAEVTISIQTCNLSVVLRVKKSELIPGFLKVFSSALYCLEEDEDEDDSETVEL